MPTKLLYFLLLFLFSFGSLSSQEDSLCSPKTVQYDKQSGLSPTHFSKEKLDQYKAQETFDYTQKDIEENWWSRLKKWFAHLWSSFWNWLLGDYQATGIIAFLLMLLPYLAILAFVAFLIWLFIKINPGNRIIAKANQGKVFLSEEEKIIENEDIPSLINQAIADKNYRLAIRFYYLYVLKLLKDKALIHYEFQKTNHDYLGEIKSEGLSEQFQKTTHLYDFIWYGEFPITEAKFQTAEKEFLKIKAQLL